MMKHCMCERGTIKYVNILFLIIKSEKPLTDLKLHVQLFYFRLLSA